MAIFLILMIVAITPNDLFFISFLVADQSWTTVAAAAANQRISKNGPLKDFWDNFSASELTPPFIPRAD